MNTGMEDRRISAVWTAAAACWIIGGLFELTTMLGDDWSTRLGVLFVAAAVTLSVKGFICQMWQCEITAFKLGQKSERERQQRGGVTSIH